MKKLVSLLLALVMVSALAACGSKGGSTTSQTGSSTGSSTATATPTSTTPVYGGSATLLYGDELMQYFDPAMADNRTYGLWMESLWTIDWGSNQSDNYKSNYITYDKVKGQIAKDWSWDQDKGCLTVHIRDDIHFQDKTAAGQGDYDVFKGRLLTASDVAYSYDRLLGLDGVTKTANAEIPWEMQLPGIDSVKAVDATTVQFNLKEHTEVALNSFMTCTVNITGPEWDKLSADQMKDWHYACGTGPYILTGFELDSYMDYKKSDNYYCTDERNTKNKLPYLDEVKLVQISDSSNIVTQFISGKLDYIGFHNDPINTSEQKQLKDTVGTGNYQEFDYDNTPVGFTVHSNQKPFDDVNVRIAMQEAIDIETIAKSYYGQSSLTLPGLWAKDLTGWTWQMDDATAATYKYNVDDAKARLAKAGYASGFDMTLYIKANSDQTLYQMAKQYLAQVGINVTIETVQDTSSLNAFAYDKTNNFAFYSGVGGNYNVTQTLGRLISTGHEYGMFNGNTDWDTLGGQLQVATSLSNKADLGKKMDEIWMKNHWAIYVGGTITLHDFVSSKIGGFTGERLCENNNTRTIVARIWSNTGK
jgi:ABC-type transport system substrate-binding protein